MKIYFHLCIDGFTNSYTILNDDPKVMEAIIVDPGMVTTELIELIESGGYKLTAVLITHNHSHHIQGLRTLEKIYTPTVYGADSESYGMDSVILNGDGMTTIAGFSVEFLSIPGHSPDSMVYKIGDALFTGDSLIPGMTGTTSSQYSKKMLACKIHDKILTMPDRTIIFPGHGAPGSIESEKMYNLDLGK